MGFSHMHILPLQFIVFNEKSVIVVMFILFKRSFPSRHPQVEFLLAIAF